MKRPAHLNFELHIIIQAEGRYQAKVAKMPGETLLSREEAPLMSFQLPYTTEELNYRLAMLSGGEAASPAQRQEVAKEFGETLFNTVFTGPIFTAYSVSLQQAMVEAEIGLRVQLTLDQAGELADLPWEFLRSPQDYLALSRQTPVVRFPKQLVVRRKVTIAYPLRLLVMISSPVDLPPLDVQKERALLEAATQQVRDQGLLEIDFLEDASLRTLQRTLRQKDYHIFHFIGHSSYDAETGVGWLALIDPFGENSSFPVRGEALARELSEENTIRLVVLNSCHGARQSLLNPAGGIASSLVTRGIPAVVANQFEISNDAATVFTEEFYQAVAEGLPMDAAMSEARRAVSSTVGNTEWATPVLYLRAEDGYLFNLQARPDAESATPLDRFLHLPWRVKIPLVIAALVILVGSVIALFSGGDDQPSTPAPTPIPNADLFIRDFEFGKQRPVPGQFTSVIVVIENLGRDPSPVSQFEFLGNDRDPRNPPINREIPSIPPGGSFKDEFSYRFNWFGAFIARIFLDPDNAVAETSERNNIKTAPIITDVEQPFVVNFSDALPDGRRVTTSRVLNEDTFTLWGFVITALPDPTGDCAAAVPWLKVVGEGEVVLGAGLPDNPAACANAPLVITLLAQDDATQEGTRGLNVEFEPGRGSYSLTVYEDRERAFMIDQATTINDSDTLPSETGVTLGPFDRANILAGLVETTATVLAIPQISFDAP